MQITPLYTDNGFGDLKSCINPTGAVDVYPSYIYKSAGHINHHIKKGSSYVTYVKGTAKKLENTSWIIGEMARLSRQGQPLYRYRKEDEALRVVLAIASKLTGEEEARLSPLTILHHTPTAEVEEHYRNVLVGDHEVIGNGVRRKFSIQADDIRLVREGDGSYYWALAKQIINPEKLVFVYDLGGKTANIAAYQGGELIEGSRFTLRRGGTYDLADMIAQDPRFLDLMRGETAKIDKIMQGLADGSFMYGSKFSFKDLIEYHETEWLCGILAETEQQLDAWFDDMEIQLFTGGGGFRAERAKAFMDNIIICPDHATANLLGIAHTLTPDARKSRKEVSVS